MARRRSSDIAMAVDYASFISAVQEEANLPYDDAERATRATLETLGERISEGQARDIAEQLPEPLRPTIIDGREPKRFDVGEFVRRVAAREGVREGLAKEHARAVFAALGQTVSPKEIEDMRAQLPSSFGDLVVAAQRGRAGRDARPPAAEPEPANIPSPEAVYDDVAARTGLDRRGAQVAVAATLEALANRISGGEVDQIATWLPTDLYEPLARGKAKSRGVAKPLPLDEFVREIADLERVDEETARRHARAVFSTLRNVISPKEYRDLFSELPDDYIVLLGRP
jgi:uncharacterized protein (DUF2267 family)